jgi:hypothetical protein
MGKTIDAFVIDPEHGVLRVEVVSDDSSIAPFINGVVDGWFDSVHPMHEHELGALNIVGYVHDEGLLLGLQPNLIASALFGRVLVGRCVVVGTLNPDGEYDGDSHDVPSNAIKVLAWLDQAFQIWRDSDNVEWAGPS